MPGGQREALVGGQGTRRGGDIGISGTAGLIFAGGIEAPAIDALPDFLFQTCGDTVGNVLNGDGGKAEGTGKPG